MDKKSENSSELNHQPSQPPLYMRLLAESRLTDAELEALKQAQKDQIAYLQKRYPNAKMA